jgi:hypothetical protein
MLARNQTNFNTSLIPNQQIIVSNYTSCTPDKAGVTLSMIQISCLIDFNYDRGGANIIMNRANLTVNNANISHVGNFTKSNQSNVLKINNSRITRGGN